MDPRDTSKMAFMSNHNNYYYNDALRPQECRHHLVATHGLRILHQIGQNLELYIDNMIRNIAKGHSHATNLKDVLKSVGKYNIFPNPSKCFIRVRA